MHQVQLQLSDKLYNEAKRRADDAGFKSVDEFVSDVITDELTPDTEDLDHLFTPERIAHLDRVNAEVKAGAKTYSIEEVSASLTITRGEWIRNNKD